MNKHENDSGIRVVLASASPSRARLLQAVGVSHDVHPAGVDEASVKEALLAENAPAFAIAETLAELKAFQVSRRYPDRLIIGADQILECEGILFDKPVDLDHAKAHLRALRGRRHLLHTSVSVVRNSDVLWHHNDTAQMTMRAFSDDFLEAYVGGAGEQLCHSVGAYQIEGLGLQLFAKIEGDFFTIQGLPLLPLLDFLRNQSVIAA